MESLRSASASAVGAGVPEPVVSAVAGRDLRGTAAAGTLRFPAGDLVVVSGLPGSGKSTLIARTVVGTGAVARIDSQDTRERWQRRLPRRLPYGLYRPFARAAHYAGLRRSLASGGSVVVHDCGTQSWVRRWLAADARRRGRGLHLVVLDVPPPVALAGQAERGRTVSRYAFARHRRALGRLLADVEAGRLPEGCASVVLLDRDAAAALLSVAFE
ncbi:ATP-binding protein [Streptomyces sp. RKND-216]|nr:ATP-binding protein [Streptomyces sp. RKND-216]